MTSAPANAPSLGRRMTCGCILALALLAAAAPPSLAATIIPIERFKNSNDPAVAFARNTIVFYGLRIKETKEDVVVWYKGKQIKEIPAPKLFQKEPYLISSYVVDDYPRQGLRTLFVPTYTGGANCCTMDILVTKTESGLVVAVVDAGSGHGIAPDAVKNGEALAVSSICAKETDLDSVDAAVPGWCTATAPRPDVCLVFDDNAWRFARPGEKPALYEKLLGMELADAAAPGKHPRYGEPLDKEVLYANAVNIVFYAVMAGKSDTESSDVLHRALPGLDAAQRRNFIANVKATIVRCKALTSRTISLAGAGSLSASSPPDAPPRDNAAAGGRFARTPCGAVADAVSKLEWFVGPDVDMTFDQARDWAKNLTACGKGWGLPTIAQLATLHDPRLSAGTGFYAGGKHWPARIDPIFSGIGGGSWAWSREELNASAAKTYNFNQGTETRTGKSGQGMAVRAFAVRGLSPAQ